MKFINRPYLFTATNQKRLITNRSDISDDTITIDGLDYSVKRRELLPEDSMWHSFISAPLVNFNSTSFSFSWSKETQSPPTDVERRTLAKSNLRD